MFKQKRNDVLEGLIGLAVLDAVLDSDGPAIYDDYHYGGPPEKVNKYRKIVEKSLKEKVINIHKIALIFYRLMRNFILFNFPRFSYMSREVICI